MLLSSPALLSFIILAFANVILAQTLTLTWPKYPEAYVSFPLTWSGGTPPYTVYVLTPDLGQYYYKYQGSELSTDYNFPLSAGTEIAFQCRDSYGLIVTSPTITVIATLFLRYPGNPQTGVSTIIQWGGGVSPYTVYVLNADQTRYYWKYTGSETSQYWTPDMAAGTEVVFQIIDYNGIKATSYSVTVQANPALSTTHTDPYTTTTSAYTYTTPDTTYTTPDTTTSEYTYTNPGTTTSEYTYTNPDTTTSAYTYTTPDTTASAATHPTTPFTGARTSTRSRGFSTSTSNTVSSNNPTQTTGGGKGNNVVPIAGGVAGGVVGLALVGVLWSFLAKQGIMGHQSGMQVDHNHNEAGPGGQGEKPTSGEPFSPDVGPHGSEYAPNAGAGPSAGFGGDGVGSAGAGSGTAGAGIGSAGAGGTGAGSAGIGSGVQGADVGGNPFAPEIQSYGPGGAYPGAGVGSDPFYTSPAGYNTGPIVGGYYLGQGLRQNQGSSGYVEHSDGMSPGGIQQQFPLPHSISYSPRPVDTAAGGPFYPSQANAPPGHGSGPDARNSPTDLRMSTTSEDMGKGIGTGLPYFHSPTSTSDSGSPLAKEYTPSPPAPGRSALPEVQPEYMRMQDDKKSH